jgi:hypothetical protein
LLILRDWQEATGNAEVLLKATLGRGTASPASSERGMSDPNFGSLREVDRFEDWTVWTSESDGKQLCFVSTIAKSVSPSEGWRTVKPYILIRVESGDDRIFHTFDKIENYTSARDLRAVVTGNSGTVTIPVSVARGDTDIKTLVTCPTKRSEMCVSPDGLRGLTRGREMTLTGTARDGGRTSITYSLIGYTDAVNEMNRRCNNQRKTDWLIKK